jgi:Na+/melibiose symporter-like transporter
LNGLILNLARLVGPALGALLAAWLGLAGIALVDAASFLVAGLCVAVVRVGAGPVGGQRSTGVWREWLDGLRVVRTQAAPRILIAFLGITGLGEGIMGTLMVPFATRVLHGTELTFGALVSAQAIGGLVGSGACAQLAGRFPAARLLGLGALLLGGIDLLIFYAPAVTPSVLVPIGLMATVGVPAALVTPSLYMLFQTRVRDEQRGRIVGAGFAIVACSGLLGMLLAGWLGDRVGIVPLLTVQSLGYIVAGSMVLRLLA